MDLKPTPNRGYTGTIQVTITAEQFPTLTRFCQRDPDFQKLMAENLERVMEEYLIAAEAQVIAAEKEQPSE